MSYEESMLTEGCVEQVTEIGEMGVEIRSEKVARDDSDATMICISYTEGSTQITSMLTLPEAKALTEELGHLLDEITE